MNSKKGFRKAKGDFRPAAAGAAALVVTTMCVTLWSGSAMAASDSGAPSASPSQQAAAQASVSLVGLALSVGAVLVTLLVVVLAVDYVRRRIARRRVGGRRGGTHAKASGPRADGAIESVTGPFRLSRPADTGGHRSTGDPGLGPPDLPRPAARPPESQDEYPSWPGPPGPYALHPDHPSWPGRPDPRWAATEAMLQEDGYPSWPERQGPPWLDAAAPVPEDDDGMPVGLAELTLPIRVRGDFAPSTTRTPMPPREAELALPGSGLQEDQGPGGPDAPGHLHEP